VALWGETGSEECTYAAPRDHGSLFLVIGGLPDSRCSDFAKLIEFGWLLVSGCIHAARQCKREIKKLLVRTTLFGEWSRSRQRHVADTMMITLLPHVALTKSRLETVAFLLMA
jgi:hypothetical protein